MYYNMRPNEAVVSAAQMFTQDSYNVEINLWFIDFHFVLFAVVDILCVCT